MPLVNIDDIKRFYNEEFPELDNSVHWSRNDIIMNLDNIPTVEAISVEWIKHWAKKNGLDCYDYDYPTEKNDWWYAIEKMLEDWEKENE